MTLTSPYGNIFGDDDEEDVDSEEKVDTRPNVYYGISDARAREIMLEQAEYRTPTPGSPASFRMFEETGSLVGSGTLYKTADEVDRRELRSMAPERLAQLQDAMAEAGLFGSKTPRYVRGFADETTRKAFIKLLGYSNEASTDYTTTLQQMLATGQRFGTPGIGGGSGAVREGQGTRLTSAVTLEQQVQEAARTRLGRKLRSSEVKRFVSIYNGIEKKASANAYAADTAMATGAPATVVAPMTAEAGADEFVDNNFEQEEAGENAFGFLDVIKKMVG